MKRETGGVTLNVHECGTGNPALVFLHYFGGSGRAWQEVIGHLEHTHRCIALDLRGFGDSPLIPAEYTVAQAADDVAQKIAEMGLTDYVLVGHSMGGKIALALAFQAPPGCRSLVLVAPSPPTPEPMKEEERERLLSTHGEREAALATLDAITFRPLSADLCERAVEDNLRSSEQAWAWWLERGSREDITTYAGNISVPMLVMVGAEDPVISISLVQNEILRRYAGTRLHVLPDAGHLLPLESAEAAAGLIQEFLAKDFVKAI